MVKLANEIWRDKTNPSDPSSADWKPVKADIREWGTWVESSFDELGATLGSITEIVPLENSIIAATRSILYADLAHAANTLALVFNDSTASYNGYYVKVGASGSGSWTKITSLVLPAEIIDRVVALEADIAALGTLASKNQVDITDISSTALSSLRDRSTHTGTQLMSTISDLAAAFTAETTARNAAIAAEATLRINADNALSATIATKADTTALTDETNARTAADTALSTSLNSLALGYKDIGPSTVATGNTTLGTSSLILCNAPVDADGTISTLRIYAQTSGTVTFAVFRPPTGTPAGSGVLLTRVNNTTHSVVSGLNEITVSIPVIAGDVYGYIGNGILRYDTTQTGGGIRYWSVTNGTTVTPASYISDNKWQFSVRINVNDRIRTVESDLNASIATTNSNVTAVSNRVTVLELVRQGYQDIGPSTLESGNTSIASGSAIVCSTPVTVTGTISTVRVYATTSGNVTLVVYRPPTGSQAIAGVTVDRVHQSSHAVSVGLNEITVAVGVIAGDIVGVAGNGILRYDTTQTGGGYRYFNLANASQLISGYVSDYKWEYSIRITIPNGSGGGGTEGYYDTDSFIAVWIVGQSNAAGRGSAPGEITIDTGRGYKYDPTTSTLIHLADPTGTDTTAQANGSPSIGPGIGKAILDATNGRVGAIIVNTAIGGTASSTWITGGSSWTAATPKWTAAIADALSKKLNVVGCIGVMILGETDAANGVSAATHKANILTLLANMASTAGTGDRFKLIISQIGIDTTNPGSSNYAAIRAAQSELSRDNDRIIMAHAGAKYFSDRSLMLDNLHYAAAAYDEIGGVVGVATLTNGIGHRPNGLE